MLGSDRVDRAMAALDAVQKEAEQALAQSAWMFAYLESVALVLPHAQDIEQGEAELLHPRVQAWKAARKDMRLSLTWAMSETRAQLDAIREAWEGRLRALLSRTLGGQEDQLQALPVEARALVKGCAGYFCSMERCLEQMQQRLLGFVRGAKAHREYMAATAYVLIRLVRWPRPLFMLVHMSWVYGQWSGAPCSALRALRAALFAALTPAMHIGTPNAAAQRAERQTCVWRPTLRTSLRWGSATRAAAAPMHQCRAG